MADKRDVRPVNTEKSSYFTGVGDGHLKGDVSCI